MFVFTYFFFVFKSVLWVIKDQMKMLFDVSWVKCQNGEWVEKTHLIFEEIKREEKYSFRKNVMNEKKSREILKFCWNKSTQELMYNPLACLCFHLKFTCEKGLNYELTNKRVSWVGKWKSLWVGQIVEKWTLKFALCTWVKMSFKKMWAPKFEFGDYCYDRYYSCFADSAA